MGLFHHHDGRVHQRADGDRYAPQRHDVGRHSQLPERDEGNQHRHRNRDRRNQSAGDVPEEQEDHGNYRQDDFYDGPRQIVDGTLDELRTVVDRDDLDARRQPRLDLLQPGLHPANRVQRVLAAAHHHDAGHGLPRAVQIDRSPPKVGTQDHLAHVPYADGCAVLRRRDYARFQVRRRFGVAHSAHHVLRAAELDQPRAGLHVAAANRVHHLVDADPEGLQLARIDVDLILPAEAAHRRHFAHARNRLEVIPQVPVLHRPQVRQALPAGGVHQDVLEDPPQPRGVRAESRLHAFRQVRQNARQVFLRARARPIQVRSVFEDGVYVGVAEIREAAHRLHLGRAEQRGHNGIRDLVLHDVGAAVPLRIDDHLRVGQVGNGVQRNAPHGPPAQQACRRRQDEHQHAVSRGEFDYPPNHLCTFVPRA